MGNFMYQYHHLPEIMSQKAARIGGLPFLTVWQFIAVFGAAGFMMALKVPAVFAFTIGLIAFVGLYVHKGEFLALRWVAIIKTAVLVRVSRPRVVNLSTDWNSMRTTKRTGGAVIFKTGEGSGVVSSVSDDK